MIKAALIPFDGDLTALRNVLGILDDAGLSVAAIVVEGYSLPDECAREDILGDPSMRVVIPQLELMTYGSQRITRVKEYKVQD